jgi:signal transduction histidine kinase/ActR/RegA family two-component response regulator
MSTQQNITINSLFDKQTVRITHLAPLWEGLRGMTVQSIFIAFSFLFLAFAEQKPALIIFAFFLVIATAIIRAVIENLLNQHRLRAGVTVFVLVYLGVLCLSVVSIREPIIIPIITIQALLPLLMGILYDLKRSPLFIGVGLTLFWLQILAIWVPLPTNIPLTDMERLVLLVNVVALTTARIINTYRIIRIVFTDQAVESQRRLDMLRVLESNLKLRNAQLEQAAAVAEESNLAKTQFLQHMSHELRSPLNTVIGLSEIISEDLEAFPPEMVKAQAHQIYKAGQHLLSVISDVLDIAKIESGTLQVLYERIDVIEIIRDLDAILVGLKGRWPDIVYTQEFPDKLPVILGEDRRIRQILINLLDNAFKYTRKGDVSLTAQEEPEGITISVQDSGIGISKENYQRIFEPFEQVAGQKSVGTGLGLAITRHLVLEHGGVLSVQSEMAQGSKFTLFLPKADLSFEHQAAGVVLLVDSDKNLQTVIKHQIQQAGFECLSANAPDDARDIIFEKRPAVVVLDIRLPTEDIGWQFLQEIIASRGKQLTVIVPAPPSLRAKVESYGATYVERPAKPSVLINALAQAMKVEADIETVSSN